MSFTFIDEKLLKKYTKTWNKIKSLMSVEFDGELGYGNNDKYIKTKIKIYGDKVNTNFQDQKVSKENMS